MKKRITAFLAAMLMCLSLALSGCGSEAEETKEPALSLAGKWIYNFHDIVLDFDDRGGLSYKTPKFEGSLSYFYDGSRLELKDGERSIGSGFVNEDGNIEFEDLNGCFYREGGSAYEPMPGSDSVRLVTNCEVGEIRSKLPKGALFFNVSEDFYAPIESDWAVISAEPEIKDGYKTITVIAACYVPVSNVPLVDIPASLNCGIYAYDKYTGLVLSANRFFEVEDDSYVHVFDSEKGRVNLSFHEEMKNSGPYGDCFDILTFTYTFRFPEWYDGLMLAAMPRPDDMETFLEMQNEPEQPMGLLILPFSEGRAEGALRYNIK